MTSNAKLLYTFLSSAQLLLLQVGFWLLIARELAQYHRPHVARDAGNAESGILHDNNNNSNNNTNSVPTTKRRMREGDKLNKKSHLPSKKIYHGPRNDVKQLWGPPLY